MRILLVEDDVKIAGFIEKGLVDAGYEVEVCHTGTEGSERALEHDYGAAIMDIMLPGIDGLEIIGQMREQHVDTPVLILSAKQSVDDRVAGLQRGGDDYMVKPFSLSELLARIEALIRRDMKNSQPTSLQVGELKMELLHQEVTRGEDKIDLPAKEYALLELLMRNAGVVLSKTTILEKVYEYSFDPQTNVVDVLVCRLRNKIDKEYATKMIHTVRGMGYVLKAE